MLEKFKQYLKLNVDCGENKPILSDKQRARIAKWMFNQMEEADNVLKDPYENN